MKPPPVAIIVLNWNNWRVTAECLESLQRLTYPNTRVLLVDNGSTDDSERILRQKFPAVEIVQTGANLGYTGGNNAGLRRALELGADYLCLLNNDVVVEPGFLEPLVAAMAADPRLGVAGGMQCSYHDRSLIQNSGASFNFYTGRVRNANSGEGDRGQCDREKEVDFICGAALLARAEMARSLGLLDDAFFMVCEDADWCLRARRAGWSVRFIPGSKIYHRWAVSRTQVLPLNAYFTTRNTFWLARRYASPLQWALFLIFFCFYSGPRAIVGRLVKGETAVLSGFLRGLREGLGAVPPHPTQEQARGVLLLDRARE